MRSDTRSINLGFDRFSGLYIWGLFIVVFVVWKPHLFATTATVHSIASQQSIGAMLGLAVLIPLAAGAYDLSIGSTVNLSTIVVIWLQTQQHWNMWPSIIVAIAVTIIIGIINGFVVVKLHVNSFIATLGMATVIAAVQTIVSGNNQPNPPPSTAWANLTQTTVFGFQIVFLYLVVLGVIVWWAMDHTPAGRFIYAVGGNPEAARLSGIKVGKYIWGSLIASATLSGIAGVFYGSLSGPSLTFGSALLLPAFAAAFLGSTQLKPGRFNVWGTLLAVFVLATGIQGLEYVTGVQWLNNMFDGVALIAAVAFAIWRQRAGAKQRPRAISSRGKPLPEPGEAMEQELLTSDRTRVHLGQPSEIATDRASP